MRHSRHAESPTVRITFDTKARMAYIYVVDRIGVGGAARTDALILERHLVNLNWNADEQLIARDLPEDITFQRPNS
jgi:hypothetical protein